MKAIYFLWILPIILLNNLQQPSGQVQRDVRHCCEIGSTLAETSDSCTNYSRPIPHIAFQQQVLCASILELCCIQRHRSVMCTKGTQTALNTQQCTTLPRLGGEYHKDCCIGCYFGLALRALGDSTVCLLKTTDFQTPWHVAVSSCCQQTDTRLDTRSNQMSRGRQLDECSKYPVGHLCDHKCISTSNSYYCECNPGYRLLSDGKTCIGGSDRCGVNNPCSQICLDTGDAIICDCRVGFQLENDKRSCADIDECVTEEDECDLGTQVCVNTIGSYNCINKPGILDQNELELPLQACPYGYEYSAADAICKDIDECALGQDNCNRTTQFCSNSAGSYICLTKESSEVCPPGYKSNHLGVSCIDIDECAEGVDACNRDREFCLNLQGTYECQLKSQSTCPAGYKFNDVRKHCEDVNECQLNFHNCAPSQRCDNTIGSFTCIRITACGTGYTLNAHTSQCEDDDECQIGNHNCGQNYECRNTNGSFRCIPKSCPTGYHLDVDGNCKIVQCRPGFRPDHNGICADYDECQTPNICRPGLQCVNSVGSYHCQNVVNCGAGYQIDPHGTQCLDIDECAQRTHDCHAGQICENQPGGYSCQCQAGYKMNVRKECEDIDECTTYGKVCAQNSVCQNTPGSYTCRCQEGFRHGENDKVCIDLDECQQYGSSICQQNCINTWGSFQCTCLPGYTQGEDKRTCVDVDECALYKGRGTDLCIGICINEPGSFSCTCPPGYTLGVDKRICQDIDECKQGAGCRGPNQICLNTRGGYKCNEIICPPEYEKDTSHKKLFHNMIIGTVSATNQHQVDDRKLYTCHKNCPFNDHTCQRSLTDAITYQFLTMPSMPLVPRPFLVSQFNTVLRSFNTQASDVRVRYSLIKGNDLGVFEVRGDHNSARLWLINSLLGPHECILHLKMDVEKNQITVFSHLFIVTILVEPAEPFGKQWYNYT